MAGENKFVVEIFGHSLNLRSSANSEYTLQLAEYVDSQIHKVSRQSNDPIKVVLLASMNIANELFEEREAKEKSEETLSRRADSLLEMVRKAG